MNASDKIAACYKRTGKQMNIQIFLRSLRLQTITRNQQDRSGIVDLFLRQYLVLGSSSKQNFQSGIFSESVSTLRASHELSRGFIAAACLHLPNENHVVFTFWALRLNRGHCLNLLVRFANDCDNGFRFAVNNPSASKRGSLR
jgi:hypothetical protein